LTHFELDGEKVSRRTSLGNVSLEPLDFLERSGDGFYPKGRKDRAVQIAGVNVYPGEVEKKILGLKGVLACAVRPGAGERLKAFVVLEEEENNPANQKKVRELVKKWFKGPERPWPVTFGLELPKNIMGKGCDW
jgi:acyl-coenzyme A synthetase/AMP-(fatty) acid ligase